nr:protein FAR1-RELATED SEQUENCE 5-like isoform X2 [Oryza sativa Japonica Group]
MRDVFSLGVRSTQLSESFNNALKNHLKSDFDIIRFLKHFERSVQDKRDKELQSEFEARKKLPRRLMCTPMLVRANQVYTPVIFEAFQSEYERSMAACARVLDGEHRYAVVVGNLLGEVSSEVEEYTVIGDPLNQKTSCSCRMFERIGILCAHGLKVLDLMNIKKLPPHYIIKRWTREACNENIQDRQGRNVVANPKLEAQLRYKIMSHKFHTLAHKVAHSPECCVVLENALDCLCTQLEEKLNLLSAGGTHEPYEDKENIDPNAQHGDDLLSATQLNKKEVQSNKSRRIRTWIDKLRKGKRNNPKSAKPTKKGVKPQVQVKDDGSHKERDVELQQYNIISDFTHLVTAPSCDDDILCDQDLF